MRNTNFICIALILFCIGLVFPANAQIHIDREYLLLGNAPKEPTQEFNIRGYSGLLWQNGDCFLKIDMTGDQPCISGSNDKVVFYDKTNKTYCMLMSAGYTMKTPDLTTWNGFTSFDPETNPDSLDNVFNKAMALNPVKYNWKSEKHPAADNLQLGLIAQQVEEVFPELVITDENGVKLVDYASLLPILVHAIQKLENKLKLQDAQIKELQQSIN